MPPKKQGSGNKKADIKKAEKLIEDKTFGLKNKNKSKKIQEYVHQVAAQHKHNIGVKHMTEVEKQAANRAKKEAKEREDAELRMLFSQLSAGAGKTSKAMEAAAEAEKAKRDAAMKKKGGDGAAEWIELDMTGKPLEEVIEYERQKLTFFKKNVTPVNEETFAKWKKEKAEKRKRENAEKVKAELSKKTKGKGLSVLSGKALFEFDASLFIDDEEAGTEQYDVSKLKSLMEEEEDGEAQGKEGEDGDEGVAVQEDLYGEGDDDDDLDDLDDDEEEAEGEGGSMGDGGGKG